MAMAWYLDNMQQCSDILANMHPCVHTGQPECFRQDIPLGLHPWCIICPSICLKALHKNGACRTEAAALAPLPAAVAAAADDDAPEELAAEAAAAVACTMYCTLTSSLNHHK